MSKFLIKSIRADSGPDGPKAKVQVESPEGQTYLLDGGRLLVAAAPQVVGRRAQASALPGGRWSLAIILEGEVH